MSKQSSFLAYDLFKLIVALILILLLIYFLFSAGTAGNNGTPPPVTQPTGTTQAPPSPMPSALPPTTISTSVPPTVEATHTLPPTIEPSATPTTTETPIPENEPDEFPAEVSSCEELVKSRIQIGDNVTILKPLNFRSSPGISDNRILANIPGTTAEVIGGPACTRYRSGGAYLWWQLELENGLVGWSAEASAYGTFYFMEPMK